MRGFFKKSILLLLLFALIPQSAMARARPNAPPAWAIQNAKFDLDFEHGRYWGGEVAMVNATSTKLGSPMMCMPDNGGLTGYAYWPSDGLLHSYPLFSNRIVPGYGLLVEDQITNYALWTRDLTCAGSCGGAWALTNASVLKNQVGADGVANSASSITATGINATAIQNITLTSRNFLGSAYIKRITGTGNVFMTIDSGASWIDITSSITGSYSLNWIPIQTLANPGIGFKLATSGDAIAVDFILLEPGTGTSHGFSYPSSPIVNTTAAQTQPNEHVAFYSTGAHPNAGQRVMADVWYSGTPYSLIMKYSGNPVGGGSIITGTDGAGGAFGIVGGGANGSTNAAYGGSSPGTGVSPGLGNWNKLAGTSNGFGSKSCINGAISTLSTGAGSKPPAQSLSQGVWTHGSYGNNGSGTAGSPLNGYVARVVILPYEFDDGQLLNNCTLINGQ